VAHELCRFSNCPAVGGDDARRQIGPVYGHWNVRRMIPMGFEKPCLSKML
jgi:hypothetical protein